MFLKSTIKVLLGTVVFAFTSQLQASLLAYYDFEGDANNRIQNSFHGVVDGATLSNFGHTGQAYSFDGTNDAIRVALDVGPSVFPKMTWGAWINVNPSFSTGRRKVLSHDNGGYDRTIGLDTRGTGTDTTLTTFTGNSVHGDFGVLAGTWQFIAGVYDQPAQTTTLYVDGLITTFSSTSFGSGLNAFSIGGNPSFNEFFGGLIDDVFIFDTALSNSELDLIRNQGVSTVPTPATLFLVVAGLLGLGLRKKLS